MAEAGKYDGWGHFLNFYHSDKNSMRQRKGICHFPHFFLNGETAAHKES
jgi:hypothetical protein